MKLGRLKGSVINRTCLRSAWSCQHSKQLNQRCRHGREGPSTHTRGSLARDEPCLCPWEKGPPWEPKMGAGRSEAVW